MLDHGFFYQLIFGLTLPEVHFGQVAYVYLNKAANLLFQTTFYQYNSHGDDMLENRGNPS
jgi:hypothetical protein